MSYTTITQATQDEALVNRIIAAAQKEAWASAEFGETPYGKQLRQFPDAARQTFIWPVSIDYETEYAYAIDSENPNPGGDAGVITDANIQASVQAHWPVADADVVNPAMPPNMDPMLGTPVFGGES